MMNFALSEEQTLLVDTARRFVEQELYPHEQEVEKTDAVRPELRRQIIDRSREIGLYAANMPEDLGGGGLDTLSMCLLDRELGRANMALQYTVGRPSNILQACVGHQRDVYLFPCIRGEKVDCLAMTEPGAGSDLRSMSCRAQADGSDFVINGTKHFISHADVADFVILFAATGTEETSRGVRKKITAFLVALVLMLGAYLLVLGPEFLDWWIGDEYVPECGELLQILMVSFLLFLPMRGVALPILMGLGRPGKPAVGLLVMGLLNLGLSVVLIREYSLVGVALGTAIPNVLFAGFVLSVACRELGVGLGEFFGYVTGRAAIGMILPVGLLLLLKLGLQVSGFLPLFLSGLGYVAVFGACWVFFVFRGDPHLDLHARLVARRKG